ncbi:MAG: hypothetical protein ACTXOO_02050 [Sodalis sp. (in: enterobacteria)]
MLFLRLHLHLPVTLIYDPAMLADRTTPRLTADGQPIIENVLKTGFSG